MADSGLIHPLALNAELGIDILQSDNGPDTDHPDAPLASKAYEPSTGDWYTKKASGWILDASTGSVSWASITGKPTTFDAAGLTGGTLTGAVAGTIFSSSSAGWTMGSVSGAARILYGASAAGAFSMLNTSNSYADLYLGSITAAATVLAKLHNGFSGSSTDITFQTAVTGDAYARGYWTANGVLWFGSGSATADTNLYRAAAFQLQTDSHFVGGGNIHAAGALVAGAYGSTPTTGDLVTRYNSAQGTVYFGDSRSSFLSFNGTSYLLGNNGGSASLGVQGQIRANGWFQSGDLTGAAAELGYSGGVAYLLGYNRSTSAYVDTAVVGASVSLSSGNGGNALLLTPTALTYGGTTVATVVVSSVDPTVSDVYPYGTIWFNKTSA